MALDTTRYRNRAAAQPDTTISSKTLPGFTVLGLGLVIIIIGAILIATYGIPNDANQLTNEPKRIAGPAVMAVGAVVFIIGVCYSIYLKKKRPKPQLQQGSSLSTNQGYSTSGHPTVASVSQAGDNKEYDYSYGPPAPMSNRNK